MEHYDAIVIGGGVIGTSIACHLARLGAKRTLLLERGQLGGGTTAQSSCILRTHYSVRENVVLAQAAMRAFDDFAAYLGDAEADCGYRRCGYLIVAPEGAAADAVRASLAIERELGIEARELDAAEARERHPLLRYDDVAVVGWEPGAGYADAYLTMTAFVRAARRAGAVVREGVEVTGLVRDAHGRVCGVETPQGAIGAGVVVSAQNIWSREAARWAGIALPLAMSRHSVMTLEAETPYGHDLPVVKDLVSPGRIYFRSYGGRQVLVSEGNEGVDIPEPDIEQADVPLDEVVHVGEQLMHRMPAFESAGLAASWTGVYDVTPDWNPVLGPVDGVPGLHLAYGFSGHGFKLSPIVGRLVAQAALGHAPDFPLAPYALSRFAEHRLLTGRGA
ncbi:MAG: FAD-binding oxidoreductase [Betaproteobacteria bacterium]|nr:FAD-binding oxidoreductase [Betaproteobacteria bacterium]